jgi:hypothetical protein
MAEGIQGQLILEAPSSASNNIGLNQLPPPLQDDNQGDEIDQTL